MITPQEHVLILGFLCRQEQFNRMLLDALKSREILSDDDERAFLFAARTNAEASQAVFDQMRELYLRIAQQAGIEVQELSHLLRGIGPISPGPSDAS